MLLLLLACASATTATTASAATPATTPAKAADPAPTPPDPEAAREEPEAPALTVELLDLGLSMYGGDGDHLPLTVTWEATAEVGVPGAPLRIEELRWVVEGEGVRFVTRSAGPPALLPEGTAPLQIQASRPLSTEEFRALRDAPAVVELWVIARRPGEGELRAEARRELTHPLR